MVITHIYHSDIQFVVSTCRIIIKTNSTAVRTLKANIARCSISCIDTWAGTDLVRGLIQIVIINKAWIVVGVSLEKLIRIWRTKCKCTARSYKNP